MKTYKHIFLLMLTSVLAFLFSCDDNEDYKRYEPVKISATDGVLDYTDLATYPLIGLIASDTPQVTLTSGFGFILDSVAAPLGSSFQRNKFEMDREFGTISYQNAGELSAGVYSINVGMTTANGIVIFKDAMSIEVLEVPITLSVDNATVDAGALQESVVATVSYTDTTTDGLITSVTYALTTPVDGFSIDGATGEISKTSSAAEGANMLSITATTNLGIKGFENLVTVTVGPPPTIAYTQLDGATALTKVTLSPWTAYTSFAPTLSDMVAVSYTVNLPATLVGFEGFFSAVADGSVSILADANLPVGDHAIGVTATNAGGVTKEFTDIFVVSVETRWDTDNPIFTEDFSTATITAVAPEVFNTSLTGYKLNASVQGMTVFHNTGKNVKTIRINQPGGDKANPIDAAFVLDLAMQSNWKNMRVSFNEGFGFADNRLDVYSRTLASSHSNAGLSGGTYDAHWNEVMAANDASWSGSSVWKDLSMDSDLNIIPFNEISLTPGESNMYLMWRVQKTPDEVAAGGSQFLFDNIRVEVSTAFAAVEE